MDGAAPDHTRPDETVADLAEDSVHLVTPAKPLVIAPNVSTIPLELARLRAYVCWRFVWYPGKGGKPGRWTKVPIDPRTGALAATDDPSTWADLETALRRYRELDCDGIGLCRNGDLIFIDLDGVLSPDRSLRQFPWALKALRAIQGRAYLEVSVTGTGLHGICRGQLPAGRRQFDEPGEDHVGFALYDGNRYFTMTGLPYHGTGDIQDLTAELAALHSELFPLKPPKSAKGSVPQAGQNDERAIGSDFPAVANSDHPGLPASFSDSELLDRARHAANGQNFQALFDYGHWRGKYPSQSEADLALCCHFAFWAGHDPVRIESLFRQSALCDEKWRNRPDYRHRTIEAALNTVQDSYNPQRAKQPGGSPESGARPASAQASPRSSSSSAPSGSPEPTADESGAPPSAPPSGPRLVPPDGGAPRPGKPHITVTPNIERVVTETLKALLLLDQQDLRVFFRGSILMEVVYDENGNCLLRPLSQDALIRYLDRAANFFKFEDGRYVRITPPLTIVVRQILCMPPDLIYEYANS